jgi:MFS family permease
MRRLLSRPDFRLFFLGVVATMVGESALLLVLAIWVKTLTGSSSLAGLTLFAVTAPALIAPVLGWVVDRFRRRPFLATTLAVTAAAEIPLLFVHGRGQVGLIYAVTLAYGASALLASAATNGMIKELLPGDLLAEANGALQTVRQGLRLVAPIGGAALFAVVGGPAVVSLDIGCLLIGALAIALVRLRESGPEPAQLHWLGEVSAGVRHLFGPASLRRGTLGLLVAIALAGFSETVIFAYVDQGVHLSPPYVSVIVSVQGIGGLTGGLLAARIVRRLGELGATALGILLFGIGFAGFIPPYLPVGLCFAVLFGLAIPIAVVGFYTLMQRITPAGVVGRVSAAADAVIGTPQALSIAVGAGLVLVVDYRILLALMAVVITGAAWYLWRGRGLTPPAAGSPANDAPAQASPVVPTAQPVPVEE